MGIRYYDEALSNKISKWIKDENMVILKPDEVTRMLQIKVDMNDDKPLSLPLITISRDTAIDLNSNNKKPLSYDGLTLGKNEDQATKLNAIPITIRYQLDIFTRHFIECDEYIRNFIFNFINHPKLNITIPYNKSNIVHNAYVKLIDRIEDNSDIQQRLFTDQFTRFTLKLELDDAYLFSVPFMDNVKLVVDENIE